MDDTRDTDAEPRIVAGKPFKIVDGRLIKTGPEQWELDGLDRPALDDHILEPGQPWEIVDGEVLRKRASMGELREEAREQGRRQQRREDLERLFELRLSRELTVDERGRVASRLRTEGFDALARALLERDADHLMAWLREDAR